jgi:hypothetical protein
MLFVTLVLKTLHSISQNGMDQITSNKQIDNHLNEDIINASTYLATTVIYTLKMLTALELL